MVWEITRKSVGKIHEWKKIFPRFFLTHSPYTDVVYWCLCFIYMRKDEKKKRNFPQTFFRIWYKGDEDRKWREIFKQLPKPFCLFHFMIIVSWIFYTVYSFIHSPSFHVFFETRLKSIEMKKRKGKNCVAKNFHTRPTRIVLNIIYA